MLTYIHTYTHTYTHTHIHTYIHTYKQTHTHICTHIHTYMHACRYIHTYIHTYNAGDCGDRRCGARTRHQGTPLTHVTEVSFIRMHQMRRIQHRRRPDTEPIKADNVALTLIRRLQHANDVSLTLPGAPARTKRRAYWSLLGGSFEPIGGSCRAYLRG